MGKMGKGSGKISLGRKGSQINVYTFENKEVFKWQSHEMLENSIPLGVTGAKS